MAPGTMLSSSENKQLITGLCTAGALCKPEIFTAKGYNVAVIKGKKIHPRDDGVGMTLNGWMPEGCLV